MFRRQTTRAGHSVAAARRRRGTADQQREQGHLDDVGRRRVDQFAIGRRRRAVIEEEGQQHQVQGDAHVAHIGRETGPVTHQQLHRRTVAEVRRGNAQGRRTGTREYTEGCEGGTKGLEKQDDGLSMPWRQMGGGVREL